MKKQLLAIALFTTIISKSQCNFTLPNDTVVCPDEILNLYGAGASVYLWEGNGFNLRHDFGAAIDTSKFSHVFGWATWLKITASNSWCTDTKTITITMKPNCATGIEQYAPGSANDQPIYYNLQGQVTERRYNELLIEQRGSYRRKIIIRE